jgi:hypothetical protein
MAILQVKLPQSKISFDEAEDLLFQQITRQGVALLSLAVRTTANSVNVRACICAHSSRATKTAHCAVLKMWHSSHFVKEGKFSLFHRIIGLFLVNVIKPKIPQKWGKIARKVAYLNVQVKFC